MYTKVRAAKTIPCGKCGLDARLFCGKCKAVRYCSKECQADDWEAHRLSCEIYNKYMLTELKHIFGYDSFRKFMFYVCYSYKISDNEAILCDIYKIDNEYKLIITVMNNKALDPSFYTVILRLVDAENQALQFGLDKKVIESFDKNKKITNCITNRKHKLYASMDFKGISVYNVVSEL